MSSAVCLNLDQSKILSSENGLSPNSPSSKFCSICNVYEGQTHETIQNIVLKGIQVLLLPE